MRNIVLTLLALLAVPAFAAPIITATETSGVVTIGYDANGTDLVSGMGIVVTLSDGTVKTGTFTDLSTDYWVHPSNIQIDAGGVLTDEGSAIAAGGEGQATITVEYGALYDGEANAPAESGALFSFEIDGATGDVTVDAITSHAGGLVTEALEAYSPSEGNALTAQVVVGPSGLPCKSNPGYAMGDINGDCSITSADLLDVINNWAATGDLCADINNDQAVTSADLLIIVNNWAQVVCTQ